MVLVNKQYITQKGITMKRQPTPTTVYKTDRIEVIRNDFRDFSLFIDGNYVRSFDMQFKAEHEGAVRLEEEAAMVRPPLSNWTDEMRAGSPEVACLMGFAK